MEQVCRVCRDSTVTLVDIFGNRWEQENEPSLAEMLSELIACEVQQDDPLPQRMCLACVVAGQNAFRFKRKCEQSYSYFMKLLCKSADNEFLEELPQRQQEASSAAADLFEVADCQFIEPTLDIKQEESFEIEDDELILSDNVKLESPLQQSSRNSFKKSVSPVSENNEVNKESSDYSQNDEDSDDSEENAKPRFRGYKRAKFRKSAKHKAYDCPHCGWSLKDKWKLQRHILSHTDERPFQCPHCDKAYKDNSLLQRHIITHPGDFPCSNCKKTFACAEGQAIHMRTNFNTDECRFKCAQCEMTFDHNRGLQKHAKTHNNRYQCSYCTKLFPSTESKTIHLRTHTNEEKRLYKYSCSQCPRMFKKPDYLKKHTLIHQAEDMD